MSINTADEERQGKADAQRNRTEAEAIIEKVLPDLEKAEKALEKVYDMVSDPSLEHEISQFMDGLIPSLKVYMEGK